MAEFPGLGEHCAFSECRQLDFLPMKCDACTQVYCKDHFFYDKHACEPARRKDVQVPVCPLCGAPVPGARAEPPDVAVGAHIDRDCRSEPAAARRRHFTNRCTVKGCRQKELVPVICRSCRRNYCLKHRHASDHDCRGFEATGRGIGDPGAAAVQRLKAAPKPMPPAAAAIQGNMTEDEALAAALQRSFVDQTAQPPAAAASSTTDNDRRLAEQLQREEYSGGGAGVQPQRRQRSNCILN